MTDTRSSSESNDMQKTGGRGSGPRRDFPNHTLQEALAVVQAIGEHNAGKPMDRILLAKAMNRSPGSSEFRLLLSSSLKYGLTEGTEKADYIRPTELGTTVIKQRSPQEGRQALAAAALHPELLDRILRHYNRNKLPQGTFFLSALERSFGVPAEHAKELADLVEANARFAGFIEEVSGSSYVRLEVGQAKPEDRDEPELLGEGDDATGLDITEDDSAGRRNGEVPKNELQPRHVFVAHGKNRAPLEDVKKILDKFKVPYKVAIDEPHAGRPISQKLADLMQSCSAAIFVFTRDEEFVDKSGETIWRPSENIVYELGAAGVLYGRKIIILKEEGVKFASDFQDLGYITFAPGELAAKGIELFGELVALEFVKVVAV